MASEAETAFELGKKLVLDRKAPEAMRIFVTAISLEPDVADYHAWYAEALLLSGQPDKSIEEATLAIQLDPTNGKGYRVRGLANEQMNRSAEAIEDYSRAINANPNDEKAYKHRRNIYSSLKSWEGFLLDSLRYFELVGLGEYPADKIVDRELRASIEVINNTFHTEIYPTLKAKGEKVVNYWPATMIVWDRRSEQQFVNGASFPMEHGTVGQGFACLSDQNLQIVSLSNLPYKYKKGRIGSVLKIFLPTPDRLEPSKSDQYWIVPNQDIQSVQIVTDKFVERESVQITAIGQTWYIYPFYDHDDQILSALRMAKSGKFTRGLDKPEPKQGMNIIALISQIADLKEKGILTEAEFESKKNDLLSRL